MATMNETIKELFQQALKLLQFTPSFSNFSLHAGNILTVSSLTLDRYRLSQGKSSGDRFTPLD